jgi:adenosine deaminase
MPLGLLASRVPKIHLHCHLEGTLRPQSFVELAGKHGVPLRYHRGPALKTPSEPVDPADPYRFKDFREFLFLFAAVSRSLQDPQDYARLAREFVEDALAQRVVYGELFVSPSVWTFFNPRLDVRATMEAIVSELRAARPHATFNLLADVTRNFGAESAMQTARTVAKMGDLDVIGISLGGDEARFPARDFAEVFAFARAQGLHRVAHAGEADGHHSVRDAVDLLGAERIGHGIRALDDRGVVETLAERRIALEICPTSNRLTGAAMADRPHPYLDFDGAGCVVTIDADDPALFGTSIEREYAEVERVAGGAVLARYVGNAIEASFASPGEKDRMAAQLAAAIAELQPQGRS